MVNEGIHVAGVDGVILLRKTISPIIYKQQIGRALATGRMGKPIIFDMVNNFDSLCNINALKEEYESMFAMKKMLLLDDDNRYEFEIIDELRDCRELLHKLRRNLGSTWEEYYQSLCIYKAKYGTAYVPKRYVDPQGIYLGRWFVKQCSLYRHGNLENWQIDLLEDLGVSWEEEVHARFENRFEELLEYKRKYGNLTISKAYVKQYGGGLAQWLTSQRREYKKADHGRLTAEQIKLLEGIGMVLIPKHDSDWGKGYEELCVYVKKYGDTLVPIDYITKNGYRLGKWVAHARYNYRMGKLNEERIDALNKINMCWDNIETRKAELHWNMMYKEAEAYYKQHGNLNVTNGYITESGLKLYTWLMQQRRIQKGKIKHSIKYTDDRVNMMNAIGMNWGI